MPDQVTIMIMCIYQHMFWMRKRNASLRRSFYAPKLFLIEIKTENNFFGVIFFMSTSLLFELSIIRNKRLVPKTSNQRESAIRVHQCRSCTFQDNSCIS